MKKIRYFYCNKCDSTKDCFVADDTHVVNCSVCGSEMTRLLSAPKCFQNTTGKSPSAK